MDADGTCPDGYGLKGLLNGLLPSMLAAHFV